MRVPFRAPTPTPIRTNPMMPEIKSPDKTNQAKVPKVGKVTRAMPGVRMAVPATFRRGGRVRRGGAAKVHKGERIVGAAGVLGKGIKAKKRLKQAEKQIKRARKGK